MIAITKNMDISKELESFLIATAIQLGGIKMRRATTPTHTFKINIDRPVLDWSDHLCMYDKVSGELFYNAGTGEFVHGDTILDATAEMSENIL